jgi:hypothetical protein
MGYPENRRQLFEGETTFLDAGPHAAETTLPVEAGFTGLVECTAIVHDAAADTIRLIAKFSVTVEAGVIVRARAAEIVDTHPSWTVATTATPPELSISSGEAFVTFVGIVGASVHATLDVRAIKT